jgi:hypothetical protein
MRDHAILRIGFWACFLVLSLSAFADDDDEGIAPAAPLPPTSWQGTYAIDFAKGKLGVITFAAKGKHSLSARYFSVDLKKWKSSELKADQYASAFSRSGLGEIKSIDLRPTEIQGTGGIFRPTYEKCEEQENGPPSCNEYYLTIEGKRTELPLKDSCQFGCNIVSADKFGSQLWLGLGSMGEEKPEEVGLQVFDLKNMKRVHQREGSLPFVIKKDPAGNAVWVGGAQGLYRYDSKFKVTRACSIHSDASLVCK